MSIIFRQYCTVEMELTESISCLEIIILQDGYQPFVMTHNDQDLWSELPEFLEKELRVQQ